MTENAVDLEARIREVAYAAWEREGRPSGRSDEFWARALGEVAALDAVRALSVPSAPAR